MEKLGKRFKVAQFRITKRNSIVIYQDSLQEALPLIKASLSNASKLLSTKNDIIINVSTTGDKFVRDRMEGVSGFALNGYSISIGINKSSRSWKNVIGGTIAHEFSHVVRFQKTNKLKSRTLLDNLAFEGIAQCFEEKVTGLVRPWSKALTDRQAREIWMRLKGKLDIESRDLYDRVFIKKDDKEFPLWTGYTIGYLLVKEKIGKSSTVDWNRLIEQYPRTLIGNGLS